METALATVVGVPPSSVPFDSEDYCTTGTISTTPIPCYIAVAKTPALSAMMLKSRDPTILTQISGCSTTRNSQSFLPQEPFNALSFVRKRRGGNNSLLGAGFIRRKHFDKGMMKVR